MDESDGDEEREFASPPCSLHELDPLFAGIAPARHTAEPTDLSAWRGAQRKRIVDARLGLTRDDRAAMSAAIASLVEELIGNARGKVVSAYWPFRGEPDLKPLLARLAAAGARTALPVVVGKGQPLVFREWKAGDPLEHGVWRIPIPAKGAEVVPDIAIAPVVGFDPQCYRLGYGGGFFDRTLASLQRMPVRIGVGYAMQRIETIHPQAYDIPMEMVVTEAGVIRPA